MMKNIKTPAEIIEQEKTLIFDFFDSASAFRIGQILIDKAKTNNVSYVINISLNRRQLFHFSPEGVSPDNDNWARRKENVVYHFFRSSYRVTRELEETNELLFPRYGLCDNDYVTAGGSFPINVKGVGVVGAITISGLPQEDDHAYVTEAISQYLSEIEK